MSELFLVIGPSGVGKSSALKIIKSYGDISVFFLDDEIRENNGESCISKYLEQIGNKKFFRESIDLIEQIKGESESSIILIDVGAGSIDWEGCIDDFLNYQIIVLTADKQVLYSRICNKQNNARSFDEYVASEFKPHKLDLYNKAKYLINTTNLNSIDTAVEIEKIVKRGK